MQSILGSIFAPRAANPSVDRAALYERAFDHGRTRKREAGVVVSEDTALTYSAVWACIKVISETVACLPWHAYRRVGNDNSERLRDGVDWLLYRQPNTEITSFTFRELLLAWALSWGNGYAEIERDGSNRVAGFWPIPPHRVTPERLPSGDIVYVVSGESGNDKILPARNVIHLHGLGYDGLTGYSVVAMAAKSIGLGMATEQFGANYFANGTHPGVIVSHPGKLSDRANKHLKESLNEEYSGLGKSHRLLLLEEAMQIEKVSFSPTDSQFLETRKFQLAEIARWFRMQPHKIGDMEHATFTNIEHQGIEFGTDTILPWVTRTEMEFDVKLFAKSKGALFSKLNMNGLLRGDSKSRAEFYRTMANLGAFCVNDMLRMEDMNTIGPVGDKRLVQLNQTTLERIGEEPLAADPAQADPKGKPQIDALRSVVKAAVTDIVTRETKRAVEANARGAVDVAWINDFTTNHGRYVQQKLQAPCDSIGELLDLKSSAVSVLVKNVTTHHLRSMREYLSSASEGDIADRSEAITEGIMDQAKRLAALERLV